MHNGTVAPLAASGVEFGLGTQPGAATSWGLKTKEIPGTKQPIEAPREEGFTAQRISIALTIPTVTVKLQSSGHRVSASKAAALY